MKTVKLNTKANNTAIVALGHGFIKYEIDRITVDADGNKTAAMLEHVSADTLKDVVQYANDKYSRETVRVYPFCTKADGESQLRLAQNALASFEKWERRNENAALNPYRRNEQDREDYIILACLAINSILEENAAATMHELKTAAFKAIANEQKSLERKTEREYNPNFIMCNIEPRKARPTFPELDRLFENAAENAALTDKQMTAIGFLMDGLSIAAIAEHMDVTKRAVACNVYSAQYKIFAAAVALDSNLSVFVKAGYTKADIDETAATLAKRARAKRD